MLLIWSLGEWRRMELVRVLPHSMYIFKLSANRIKIFKYLNYEIPIMQLCLVAVVVKMAHVSIFLEAKHVAL